MQWITILLSIIPLISKLMKIAEEAFDGIEDSGAKKKEMVLAAVESLVDAVSSVTGGKSEIWEKIKGPISTLSPGFLSQKTRKFLGRFVDRHQMRLRNVFAAGSFFHFGLRAVPALVFLLIWLVLLLKFHRF